MKGLITLKVVRVSDSFDKQRGKVLSCAHNGLSLYGGFLP